MMTAEQTGSVLLPPVGLLSWFGGVLCIDLEARTLRHVPLRELRPFHVPVALEEGSGGAQLSAAYHPALRGAGGMPGLIPVPGALPGAVSIQSGDHFLTAVPLGLIRSEAEQAKNWEHFYPVTGRDIALLGAILGRHWRIAEAAPVPAGLDGFALKLGTLVIPFADHLPFAPESDATHLHLTMAGGKLHAIAVPAPPRVPEIWLGELGNIGNRALRYLTAASIAAKVPGARITNLHLQMWDRVEPAPRPPLWAGAELGKAYHLDIDGLADCLNRGEADALCLESYCFHLAHYPPRETCRALLPKLADPNISFGPDELVCSIRGGEILRRAHPDYFPLPPAYYELLRRESGLSLVFFGQLGDDPYTENLRAAFPQARFVPGTGEAADFEVLRRAPNLALSISTFAWLAAWLGSAQRVYVPVGGMFHPVQHRGQLYLPLDEPSFQYVLLPPVTSVDLAQEPERFWLIQDLLGTQARLASPEEIRDMVQRAARYLPPATRLQGFSSAAYMAANHDAGLAVNALRTTALGHYMTEAERRRPSRLDPLYYAIAYPDAAQAVALGEYPDLDTHYREEGMARGYRPLP